MRVTNYALPPENKIDDAKRMPLSFSNYITVKGMSPETAILWLTISYQRRTKYLVQLSVNPFSICIKLY
jgi:hypothetical protein